MGSLGKSINSIFKAMKEKWEPTEINQARNRRSELLVKNGWYYEKINDI